MILRENIKERLPAVKRQQNWRLRLEVEVGPNPSPDLSLAQRIEPTESLRNRVQELEGGESPLEDEAVIGSQ